MYFFFLFDFYYFVGFDTWFCFRVQFWFFLFLSSLFEKSMWFANEKKTIEFNHIILSNDRMICAMGTMELFLSVAFRMHNSLWKWKLFVPNIVRVTINTWKMGQKEFHTLIFAQCYSYKWEREKTDPDDLAQNIRTMNTLPPGSFRFGLTSTNRIYIFYGMKFRGRNSVSER